MALIPGNADFMNDVEIQLDASISEQLFNKIGANINHLLSLAAQSQEFLVNGVWVVPESINRVFVFGIGGGGGGGGATIAANVSGGGGGGGIYGSHLLKVIPFESYTITIGTKGLGLVSANGTNGGTTSFTGTTANVFFQGGGGGGANSNNGASTGYAYGGTAIAGRGAGGAGYGPGGSSNSVPTSTANGLHGGGGAAGSFPGTGGINNFVSVGAAAGSLSGGGGSGLKIGGAGGAIDSNGVSAAIANSGAGGGGAGTRSTSPALKGGDGADGYLFIAW